MEPVRQDGRTRKTTNSVEKQTLKGSMSKIVTQTTSLKGTAQGIALTKNLV